MPTETEAIAAIEAAGGKVTPASGGGWQVEFQWSGRDFTDDGMASVAALPDIVTLNLRDTGISSAGLAHLAGLSQLRRLHLERTAVDDAGIARLAPLKRLEYLNLYGTKITDAALGHLAGLDGLSQLYVWGTGVSEAGARELQLRLAGLKISRGVDLDAIAAAALQAVAEKEAEPLEELKWIDSGLDEIPGSVTGSFMVVTIENSRDEAVKLYWSEYGGRKLRYYAEVPAMRSLERTTYSNAVWLITTLDENRLGYFRTGTKNARVVIPKS